MLNIKSLKPGDIIKNNAEGFLKDEYGVINYSTGKIAVATFIKVPEHPFIIGIWNANELDLVEV